VPELKKISGENCKKILCKYFGFEFDRQRGSHMVLKKQTAKGKIVTVIPNHKELKIPILKSALKLAKVEFEDFARYQ
jgi:predicted RNA binding protein YcfA (HicA-like mRNA interferase family)